MIPIYIASYLPQIKDNKANYIISLLLTILILWLIKGFVLPETGFFTLENNIKSLIILIPVVILTQLCIKQGIIQVNLKAVLIGTILFLIMNIIFFLKEKRDTDNAKKDYISKRKLDISAINREQLKELLIECKKNKTDFTKRKCTCNCQFSDKELSPYCITYDAKNNEVIDMQKKDPKKCFPLFGCGDTNCSVFNTTVDHISGCIWVQQDMEDEAQCLCLLSKITQNEELKALVEEIEKKIKE